MVIKYKTKFHVSYFIFEKDIYKSLIIYLRPRILYKLIKILTYQLFVSERINDNYTEPQRYKRLNHPFRQLTVPET